jgi:hypothetical protein
MCPELTGVRGLFDAGIASFSMLGGLMVLFSGLAAASAVVARRRRDVLGHWINLGVAVGFLLGLPIAAYAFAVYYR